MHFAASTRAVSCSALPNNTSVHNKIWETDLFQKLDKSEVSRSFRTVSLKRSSDSSAALSWSALSKDRARAARHRYNQVI